VPFFECQENSKIRELQSENLELRQSLADHQSALEVIMTKYREQLANLTRANEVERSLLQRSATRHEVTWSSFLLSVCMYLHCCDAALSHRAFQNSIPAFSMAPCRLRVWCTLDLVLALYMYCLLVYIVCFPTYSFFSSLFLTYLLPYLSFSLRIYRLFFHAGCRKRRLNLALAFWVYFVL